MKLEKGKKHNLMEFVRYANTFEYFQELLNYTRKHRNNYDCAHDETHSYRTFALSILISRMESTIDEVDENVLLLTSFFHDIISPAKDSKRDIKEKGMSDSLDITKTFLVDHGFSEEVSLNVLKSIEQHSFSRGIESDTLESKIFSDADKLDAVGYSGILRMMSVAGSLRIPTMNRVDGYSDVAYDEDHMVATDHINKKLKHLKGSLYFDFSKELFDDRFNELVGVITNANYI